MFKDQLLGTDHLDELKNVTSPEFLRIYFEMLSDEECLSKLKRVVHLFAGNCSEAVVAMEYLEKAGNKGYEIVAVDKTPPTNTDQREALSVALGERFQFVVSDAIEYLESLPSESVDVITAFGAEYVFSRDSRPHILQTYLREIVRVLKSGGDVVSPSVPFPGESRGFEQIYSALAQKKRVSSP